MTQGMKNFVEFWRHKDRTVEVRELKQNPEGYVRECFVCGAMCEYPNLVNFSNKGSSYVMTKWICQSCCVEAGWLW